MEENHSQGKGKEKLELHGELEEDSHMIVKDAVMAEDISIQPELTELVAAANLKNALLCNPCLFDEAEEKAIGFCVICVEYLCQGCCRDHKKSKITRNHNILKDDLPEDATIFRLMKEMTSCSEHSEIQVSHRCEDHKAYVCVMCIAGNHRKCDHVTELVLEVDPTDTKTTETAEKLDSIQEKSTQVIKSRQDNLITLVSEKIEIQNSNAILVQQIHDSLLLLAQSAASKAENLTESEMSRLRKDIDICKSLENERMIFSQLLETAKQHGSSMDIEVVTDVIQNKIFGINQTLEKQQKKSKSHLKLTQNPLVNEIKTLGQLKVYHGEPKERKSSENNTKEVEGTSDEIIDEDESTCATPKMRRGISRMSSDTSFDGVKDEQKVKGTKKKSKHSKKEKKFSVRVAGDVNDCTITGIVILQDGRIAVLDQENRKIKVYSSGTCKCIFAYSLDFYPSDICTFGPSAFAVVYKDLAQIDIYKIEGKSLKVVRCWKTKYENVRITMDRELIAVLCKTDRDARVQLRRDTDCKVLLEATLPVGTDQKFDFDGCSLCSSKDDLIVASKTSGILFLARTANLESLAITRTLNFNEAIPGLRGVTADKDGNLYVCAPSSKSVIQVSSKDYTEINTVVSGICMPVSLAISNKKDHITVGCQNDNYMHVFNLNQ